MEYSEFDKRVHNLTFNKGRRMKKRVYRVGRKTGATPAPPVMVSNGEILVKTGVSDNLFKKKKAKKPMVPAGAATTGAAIKVAKKKKKKGLFKKIVKGIAVTSTGGASLLASKKGRKKLGKAAKKVGKVVKKVTSASLLLPLLPLKPVMKKALSKKGLKPPKKTEDLIRAFYDNIVKRSSSYETMNYDRDNFAPIAAIIPPVLNFVKGLLSKKKSGQNMTPVEESIANDSEKVVAQIESKAEQAGISVAPEMPGSNAKDNTSDAGGIGAEKETPKEEPKKRRREKRKEISLGGISTPLLIAGGIAAAVMLKK